MEDSDFFESDEVSRELFNVIIELGDNKEDCIVVHRNDSPGNLASNFCIKHGFGPEQQKKLTFKITQFMEQVLLEEETESEVCDEQIDELQSKLAKINQKHKVSYLSQIKDKVEDKTSVIDFTSIKKLMIKLPKRSHFTEVNTPSKIKLQSKEICKTIDELSCEEFQNTPLYKSSVDSLVERKQRSVQSFYPNKRQKLNTMSACDSCKKFSTVRDYMCNRVSQDQYERIYQMGIAHKETRKRQIQEREQEKVREELKYATFHPKIIHNNHKPSKSFQDHSNDHVIKVQKYLESAKLKIDSKVQEKCTFKQKINEK